MSSTRDREGLSTADESLRSARSRLLERVEGVRSDLEQSSERVRRLAWVAPAAAAAAGLTLALLLKRRRRDD